MFIYISYIHLSSFNIRHFTTRFLDSNVSRRPPTHSAEERENHRAKSEDSAEEGQDSAQDIARAMKKWKKPKPRPTKRQKQGPVPRLAKGRRKTGWRATEEQAVFQDTKERIGKKAKWEEKMGKIKTAFVKKVVKNAFGAETKPTWKETRYTVEAIVMEKEVMLQPLI